MTSNELKIEELELVNGGSIFRRESEIRAAGIDLLKDDGTPGEFGYIWNTGDYYFNGQKLGSGEVDALLYYRTKMGIVAPSVKTAHDFYLEERRRDRGRRKKK